jgi:GntR family transcriptional regulator
MLERLAADDRKGALEAFDRLVAALADAGMQPSIETLALRARIAGGEWPPGFQIPTEDQLCETFGVSRITVRQGVQKLETEGLLRRDQGRGTFVRDARLVAGTSGPTSFTEEVLRLGVKAGSKLIDATVAPATERVAQALGIAAGDEVTVLRRLRLGDGAPMGVQTAHIRLDRAPGLHQAVTDDASLYELLRERYGIAPREANELYRVDSASDEDAAVLGIAAGSPVFVVERTTVDAVGAYEFTVSTMRGDRYEIRATLRTF